MGLYTGIAVLVIMFFLVMRFMDAQRTRLNNLEYHDRLYNSCIEKEKQILARLKHKFKITPNEIRSDGSDDIAQLVDTLKFRYSHLYALSQIDQLPPEINITSGQIISNYNDVLKLHDERHSLLLEYTNEFGELQRQKPLF